MAPRVHFQAPAGFAAWLERFLDRRDQRKGDSVAQRRLADLQAIEEAAHTCLAAVDACERATMVPEQRWRVGKGVKD